MSSISGIGWANSNSGRNYPFADSVNLSIDSAGFIPNDFIVDARIYVRNTYESARPPYVKALQILSDKAIIKVACNNVELGSVEIPYSLIMEQAPNENKGIYVGANGVDLMAICPMIQNGVLGGTFVVTISAINIIQSLEQKTYEFTPNRLEFVAAACEYLPGPQVTSINGVSGEVILRGETGILVEKVDNTSSDIKISIVGDPHFTRFNCIDNPLQEDATSFLEQLTVIHRLGPAPSNLAINSLKVMNSGIYKDGSIDFSLKTGVTPDSNSSIPLNQRPALRITVEGNTLKLGMAGG